MNELRAFVGVDHRFATKEEHLLHSVGLARPGKEGSVGRRGGCGGRSVQRHEKERDASEASRAEVQELRANRISSRTRSQREGLTRMMMMITSWMGAVQDICNRVVSLPRSERRRATYVEEAAAEVDARDVGGNVVNELSVR